MGACAVFVDAGYAEKVFSREHYGLRVDYSKLAVAMAEPETLFRAYYYNCLPYQSDPPTEGEKEAYDKKRKFTDALEYLPRFQVRLGRLAKIATDLNGKPVFQQKRVDLMLGVDMALLAGKGKITNVSLFTGDSDYIPAVEAVKQEGVIVTLWHGAKGPGARNSPSRDLYQLCDERRDICSIIQSVLMDTK